MQTDETENQRGLCGLGCHRAAGILTAFGTDGFRGSDREFRGHNVLEICDAAVEDIAELCERGVVGLNAGCSLNGFHRCAQYFNQVRGVWPTHQ
jgi:hypothetical protein